jgi:hypothetical protein
MPRVDTAAQWTGLTLEERREWRRLRREKQREDNVKRAAKMHVARIKINPKTVAAAAELEKWPLKLPGGRAAPPGRALTSPNIGDSRARENVQMR